jgi:hypothetical protein
MTHCYKLVVEYNLDSFTGVWFPIKPNEIILQFSEHSQLVSFLDDINYYKVLKILHNFAQKKGLVPTDNLYDKIN